MPLQVIEGIWEEIKRHEAELINRQLRVTIITEEPLGCEKAATADEPSKNAQQTTLSEYGAFKDAVPLSEEYLREKRAEIEREERRF